MLSTIDVRKHCDLNTVERAMKSPPKCSSRVNMLPLLKSSMRRTFEGNVAFECDTIHHNKGLCEIQKEDYDCKFFCSSFRSSLALFLRVLMSLRDKFSPLTSSSLVCTREWWGGMWIKEVIKVWKYAKRFITSIIAHTYGICCCLKACRKGNSEREKFLRLLLLFSASALFFGYKQITCDKERNYVIKQCWLSHFRNINGTWVSCHFDTKTKALSKMLQCLVRLGIDLKLFIINI